jgi:hypothetical protein
MEIQSEYTLLFESRQVKMKKLDMAGVGGGLILTLRPKTEDQRLGGV